MTRARQSDLVLNGNEVAYRLKAERNRSKSLVHVDWVRFTCRLKNAPLPDAEDLFPSARSHADSRMARLLQQLRDMPDPDFSAAVQAKQLAQQACEALGVDFSVAPEVRKGHDFYRCRWSIVRNDVECGWVGYLASGESPRQQAQGQTIHVNLYGSACTYADHGWNHRVADLVRSVDAVITRVDLALDFFDGLSGGMERVQADYMAGLMDSRGRKPSCNQVGDWCNGRARSFYFGSKEAGKQTNAYEKGHQLFGPQDDSPWLRVELRYGNKMRVLDAEILNRPDDFFAGASEWHATVLREANGRVSPEPIKVKARLAVESITAEITRNLRWAFNTAAPTLALLFKHVDEESFLNLVTHQKLPGRLAKFKESELSQCFQRAAKRIKGSGFGRLGLDPYQVAVSA